MDLIQVLLSYFNLNNEIFPAKALNKCYSKYFHKVTDIMRSLPPPPPLPKREKQDNDTNC